MGNSHKKLERIDSRNHDNSLEKRLEKLRNKYVITSHKIGESPTSKVMLAVNIETKTEVVVKIIKRGGIETSRLQNEIDICLKLNHPNIVKYYDAFFEDDNVYLISEYCEGGDLMTKIENEALDEEQARSYFVQLMSALEYLHVNFIAHRDLKPENVLMNKNTVKIGDFGFSLNVTEDKRSTQCGTPGYFAPEILDKKGYQPLMSDIWSMGVMLYAMVCNKYPFGIGSEYIDTVKRGLLEVRYPKNVLLTSELKDLLKKMLERDPEKRIDIEGIKNHPWIISFPKVTYQLIRTVDLDKVKKIVDMGCKKDDVYKSIFNNDVTSIYLGMYNYLVRQDIKDSLKKAPVRAKSSPIPKLRDIN